MIKHDQQTMRTTYEITKKELSVLFTSPIGWVVAIIFTIQLSTQLSNIIRSRTIRVGYYNEAILSLTYSFFFLQPFGLISGLIDQLYLFLPLITMGLLSREFSDGTTKLLFSSPVKVGDIVMGKFLAMMAYCGVITGIVGFFGMLAGLYIITAMDVGLLIAGMLLLFLLLCTYSAVGLFISSLTSYPFIAALGGIGALFGLQYASTMKLEGLPEAAIMVLGWLQGISFLTSKFQGFVGSWDILYFVVITLLFVALTYVRIQSMRESEPWWVTAGKYLLAVAVVVFIGYISSHPALRYYLDVRADELRDTSLMIGKQDVGFWKTMLYVVVPAPLVLLGTLIVVRRRNE